MSTRGMLKTPKISSFQVLLIYKVVVTSVIVIKEWLMVHRRFCSLVIWIASLALLCSLKVQAAEIDSSLSNMDTFDYVEGPQGGDYEYEPILIVPDTNKPTVTKPTDTPSPGA